MADLESVLDQLAALLGPRLLRSAAERDRHGASESHFAPAPPDAVAYPETTDEVSRLVAICAAGGLPVIGFGVGTSLEGQTSAVRGGVAVDFARMNRVLAVHAEDMDVVVQPGLTREALNRELRTTGLFFPVDPGANASLGGMAATRASGTTAVRYGTMRGNVLALEVVLAGRAGDPHRQPGAQILGRLRPDRAVRRIRRHPRADHRTDPAPAWPARGDLGRRSAPFPTWAAR